jgi:hypothetical protein
MVERFGGEKNDRGSVQQRQGRIVVVKMAKITAVTTVSRSGARKRGELRSSSGHPTDGFNFLQ